MNRVDSPCCFPRPLSFFMAGVSNVDSASIGSVNGNLPDALGDNQFSPNSPAGNSLPDSRQASRPAEVRTETLPQRGRGRPRGSKNRDKNSGAIRASGNNHSFPRSNFNHNSSSSGSATFASNNEQGFREQFMGQGGIGEEEEDEEIRNFNRHSNKDEGDGLTRQQKVELLFSNANNSISCAQSSQSVDGYAIFKSSTAVSEEYKARACKETWENVNNNLVPPVELMGSMCATAACWRVVDSDWINKRLPFARNTGPCVSFCRKNHTPNIPDDFKQLAYFVSCINGMPNYDECIVPTENTILKWSSDGNHILGMQHTNADIEERMRQRSVVSDSVESKKQTFMGLEIPCADEVAYMRDDSMDDTTHVTVDPIMLVVSVVPVFYTKEDEDFKETFWIATLIPLPGVNILKCIEKVCRPFDLRNNMDRDSAKERSDLWKRLCCVECFQSYNISVREWDHAFTMDTFDNYTDRRHPFSVMSTSSVMHKILHALPPDVECCSIFGMPKLNTADNIQKFYENHVTQWELSIRWVEEFNEMSKLMFGLRQCDRKYVPKLNLPVVPGMAMQIGTDYVYYNQLGNTPLNMLWKPMLTLDFRTLYDNFFCGKLPMLAQGTLMSWIFDGDIDEFLSDEYGQASEEKVFDKYYRGHNKVLDEYLRSGCLANWRESVMDNIAKMLQCNIEEVNREEFDCFRVTGEDEDFNDDFAWQWDEQEKRLQVENSDEDLESNESDSSENDGGAEATSALRYSSPPVTVSRNMYTSSPLSLAGSLAGSHYTTERTPVNMLSQGERCATDVSDDTFTRRTHDLNPEMRQGILFNAVEKLQKYMLTAWKWHCSMIEGGAYQSDVIENANEIIQFHLLNLGGDMRKFVDDFMENPSRGGDIYLQARTSAVSLGCYSFQGAILHINSVANMNAINLTTFREIFTSTVGVYLGSSNKTWACFFWPIQVAVGHGNFILTTKEHSNVPYWVKPNSAGMDSVLVPRLMDCRKLFQVKMKTTESKAQAMMQLSRSTPKALEDLGRILLDGDKVVQKPTKQMRFQPILMTEQRKMTDVLLNGLITALPRHDQSSDTLNKILSTDVSAAAGGARRATESIRIDMMKMILCGTNVPAERWVEGECLQTLRSSFVVLPPGGPRDAGKIDRKRKREEFYLDSSKGDCMFFQQEEEKEKLCPGMCIAPAIASSVSLMNDFGLIRIEVSEMVNDLYAWYQMMFQTFFKWICAPSLINSFQRLLAGWKARGVADTVLYRTIGRFCMDGNADVSMTRLIFSLAFDAHDITLVPTQVHQNIRGVVDSQVILIARIVSSVLRLPVVPFTWLFSVLTGELEVDIQRDKNAALINQWLSRMVNENCFLPHDLDQEMNYDCNVSPYVSTSPRDNDGNSILKFSSNGHNTALSVAQKFSHSSHAQMAFESMGIPKDPNIYKNAISTFCETHMDLSLFFNSFDTFNIERFFTLFKVANIPNSFQRNTRFMRESNLRWEMGRILGIVDHSGSEHNRKTWTTMGIHVTGILVLSSLLLSNSEGKYHSNMSSNSARNIVQAISTFSSKSSIGGDGNTVLLKNFAYSDATPRPTMLHVVNPKTQNSTLMHEAREYFLRPRYDMQMHKSCRLGYLPGRYKNYMYEDCVHLHGILSLLSKLNIDQDNLRFLPMQSMRFDYSLVLDRTYPVIYCGNERGFKTACITLDKKNSCRVEIWDQFEVGDIDADIDVNNTGSNSTSIKKEIRNWDVEWFQVNLHANNMLIYPLVHRRNALVYSNDTGLGYGVIVPVAHDVYFDKHTHSYKIHWNNGKESHVPFMELDKLLVAVASHVYIPLTCQEMSSMVDQIKLPVNCTFENTVFRCNVYYPSDNQECNDSEYDYTAVFVSVATRQRLNGNMQRAESKIYSVALANIMTKKDVDEKGLKILDILWFDPR